MNDKGSATKRSGPKEGNVQHLLADNEEKYGNLYHGGLYYGDYSNRASLKFKPRAS